MKTSAQFFDIIYRTARVIPSFAVMAIGGLLVTYKTHAVPAEQAAVFVGVPLVWGFAMVRALTLTLPAGRHRGAAISGETTGISVPIWFVLGFVALFVTVFLAVDGVLSSVTFMFMRFYELAQIAADLAKRSAFGVLVSLAILSCFFLRRTFVEMYDALLLEIWHILLLPRRLADSIPGLFQHVHRN